MKLLVFGKKVEIVRVNGSWKVYYLGSEGKKRKAWDIVIPDELDKSELIHYLEDILHESATPSNNQIFEII